MRRNLIILAVAAALALFLVGAPLAIVYDSNFNHSFQSTATDVSAASGSFTSMNAEDTGNCVFAAELTALSDGTAPTVAFKVRGSIDDSTYLDVSNTAILSTTGTAIFNVGATPKFVKMSWVTTGDPNTATAIVLYSCKR